MAKKDKTVEVKVSESSESMTSAQAVEEGKKTARENIAAEKKANK